MTALMQRVLASEGRADSRILGMFLWQLDDQIRRLTEQSRGATPEELAWQIAPGMNTIGMLLAHIAAVEVGWISRGIHGGAFDGAGHVLPIRWEDAGIPLAADGRAPGHLVGKDLAYYDDLMARARSYTRESLASLTDADLDRRFRFPVPWMKDTEMEINAAWTLYHVLEHLAGHYGQINLLRHQYRARPGGS